MSKDLGYILLIIKFVSSANIIGLEYFSILGICSIYIRKSTGPDTNTK